MMKLDSDSANKTKIVLLGDKPDKLEELAAKDLAGYLEKITGFKLEIQGVSNFHQLPEKSENIIVLCSEGAEKLPRSILGEASLANVGNDGFVIKTAKEADRNYLLLYGKTPRATMYSAYHLLENYCGVGFYRDGDAVPKQDKLSFDDIECVEQPSFEYRGFVPLPIWGAVPRRCPKLWTFSEWKQLIDWMRKKKMNDLLMYHCIHQYIWGDIFYEAFPETMSDKAWDEEWRGYVIDPAQRTELNEKIVNYLRETGVGKSYCLWYGYVPRYFKEAHPELLHHDGQYDGTSTYSFICASQPECKEMMRKWWSKIFEKYGTSENHVYVVCYMHERPDWMNCEKCKSFFSRAKVLSQAYEVLREFDPEAQVLLETWCWSEPSKEMADLRELPEGVGVCDLSNRRMPSYDGRKWIFQRLTSFEGHDLPFNMITPADVISQVRDVAEHGAMGVAAFNIAGQANPAICDLMAELAWDSQTEYADFLKDYVTKRYGEESAPKMLLSYNALLEAADSRMNGPSPDALKKHQTEFDEQLVKDKLAASEKALQAALSQEVKLADNKFYKVYLTEAKVVNLSWKVEDVFKRGYLEAAKLKEVGASKDELDALSKKVHDEALAFLKQLRKLCDIPEYNEEMALSALKEKLRLHPYFLEHWRELGSPVYFETRHIDSTIEAIRRGEVL